MADARHRDWRLASHAALLLVMAGVGVRTLPVRAWIAAFRLLPSRRGPSTRAGISRALDAAQRRLPGCGQCLTRALAEHALLKWEGHPSTLRIGVRRNERGAFEAHAWVDPGETNGEDASSFQPILAFSNRI